MDIFHHPGFFLMVNSSDVQVLNPSAGVHLPSQLRIKCPEIPCTTVTENDILVGNRPIVPGAHHEDLSGNSRTQFEDGTGYQSSKARTPPPPGGRQITIVADRELPYELLKKIMSTCGGGRLLEHFVGCQQKS